MSTGDLHALPTDLPVPLDDGAAHHLPGRRLPALSLPSTLGGQLDLAETASRAGTLVQRESLTHRLA
jgi:hypothetical protein